MRIEPVEYTEEIEKVEEQEIEFQPIEETQDVETHPYKGKLIDYYC